MTRKDVYVTYVQDNQRDAVRYSNQIDYWDAETQSYLVWARKKCSKIWHNVGYRELMDGSVVDAGRLLMIMEAVEPDNAISLYDKHTHKRRLATKWADIATLLDISGGTWKRFAKKLRDKNIIREITIKGINGEPDYTHYYVNPLITMGSGKLSLQCYKLFQAELDKVLPQRAIMDLQRHWAEERGDTYEPETPELQEPYIDAVPVKDAKDHVAAPKTEPMTEAVKWQIFSSYVCGGKNMQMYQLKNNGMFATTQPDPSKDTWFTPNRIDDTAYHDGRKKAAAKEITQFNNWFMDVDAGKDDNNNYYDLAEVERRKKDMLAVIATLPEPTAIVETRNGYHIYWSCYEVKDLDTWQEIETKLIDIVKIADPHARDVARLLRVPYSTWHKIPSEPYKIKLISAARNQYPAADMLSLLDTAAAKISTACKAYNNKYGIEDRAPKKAATNNVHKTYNSSQPAVETPDNANIRAVKSLEIPVNYTAMPLVPYTGNIAKEIKSKVSIAELLGLQYNTAFRCILDDHQDIHPSAMIYKNEQGDRYVCSCLDRRGVDIIDLVQRLAHCGYNDAIGYLGRLIGIYSPQKVRAPKKDEKINLIDKTMTKTQILRDAMS